MKRQHREKELSENQLLKKENRELKKQVRTLEHRLRELEKHEHMFERESGDEKPEEVNMEDTYTSCESCGKGVLVELEILDKVFATCNVCGDRKKLK